MSDMQERIQNAKDKGTYLTKAEKERRRANQERLDALRAAGLFVFAKFAGAPLLSNLVKTAPTLAMSPCCLVCCLACVH